MRNVFDASSSEKQQPRCKPLSSFKRRFFVFSTGVGGYRKCKHSRNEYAARWMTKAERASVSKRSGADARHLEPSTGESVTVPNHLRLRCFLTSKPQGDRMEVMIPIHLMVLQVARK